MRLVFQEYGSVLVASVVTIGLLFLFSNGFQKQIGELAEEPMKRALFAQEEKWSCYWMPEEIELKSSGHVQASGNEFSLSDLVSVTVDGEAPILVSCTYLKCGEDFLPVPKGENPVFCLSNPGVYEMGIRIKSTDYREYDSYFFIPVGEGGSL